MKIRKMFVANSSSATYVVRLPIDINVFMDDMLSQYSWSYFDQKELLEELIEQKVSIENSILEIEKRIGENPDKNTEFQTYINSKFEQDEDDKKRAYEGLQYFFWNQDRKRLEDVLRWIEKINECKDMRELVKDLLINYYNITFQYDEQNKIVTLSSFTSMHNDYRSMSELLKDITLFYLMETGIKPQCELIDHDMDINNRFIDFDEEE